jgi:hypothetical protein
MYFQHYTGNRMSPLQSALNGHTVAQSQRLSTLTKHDGVQFASQVRRRLFEQHQLRQGKCNILNGAIKLLWKSNVIYLHDKPIHILIHVQWQSRTKMILDK